MTKTPNESPTMTTHTPARIFNVETQFQKMARRSGGISRERAIERAEIEIEEVKVQFDEWLDQELAGIATAIEAARLGPDNPEWLADAAGCSRRVRDASATMRFELLSFVANSLCDLLDSIATDTEYAIDSVVCHLEALNLSRRPEYRHLRPDEVPELTKGLRRVVTHASA
ncbi:MAG: hypothetical protein ACLP19_11680 [Xanthobacteraceae bacterium]